MKSLIVKTSKKKIIAAELTIGIDDAAFGMRFKNNPKAKPIKAILGRKHIHFKHPPIQWEQKYKKIKDKFIFK